MQNVWADEWVASVILVLRCITWLKNNARWQNGGRSGGCQFEISLQMCSVLTRVRHNMSSAEAECRLTGHGSPEHPSKLLILKVLMTQAQILLRRNCQAAALKVAGVPVRNFFMKYLFFYLQALQNSYIDPANPQLEAAAVSK